MYARAAVALAYAKDSVLFELVKLSKDTKDPPGTSWGGSKTRIILIQSSFEGPKLGTMTKLEAE